VKYYFLSGLLLLCAQALGQANKVLLTGTITMQTGEQFPYKIVGTEQNGVLKGFAYTYSEPDETKAVIEGQIDRQKHKLSFKETEIVSSHDVHTTAFMCLVHAKLDYKGSVLSGPATSKELDNTACTEGVISFGNRKEIDELFSSHSELDMEVSMGGKKVTGDDKPAHTEPKTPATEEPAKLEKITAGVEKAYDWYSDSINIEIWDGGNFDGDKVTITLDDKPFLKRYTIQKLRKHVVIPILTEGVHYLSIYADDEGLDPPNTANLTLTDGDKHYNLLAYNPKGSQSLVQIKKIKKK
jgi:hypothetical protein